KGIGAEIRLRSEGFVQSQTISAGGRYLSSDQPLRSFAALSEAMELEVAWPSGKISRLSANPNHHYEISEREAESPVADTPAPIIIHPWFEDWSDRLNHVHVQPQYDDFARQPSLPWKLSSRGPAACWLDINHDGWEDLFISGAKGVIPSVYL